VEGGWTFLASQYKAMLQCQKHCGMSNRNQTHPSAIGRPGMPSPRLPLLSSVRSFPDAGVDFRKVLNVP